MKKLLFCLVLFLSSVALFAQNNVSVAVTDPIYDVIDNAQLRGLVGPVSGAKPYTEKKILSLLEEILEKDDKLNEVELKVIQNYLNKNKTEDKQFGSLYYKEELLDTPISVGIYYQLFTDASAGIYNKSEYTSTAFDFIPQFSVNGDIGKNLGFNFNGVFNFAKIPLRKNGNGSSTDAYYIGDNWFKSHDEDGTNIAPNSKKRYIPSFSNDAWLPFTNIYSSSGQYYWVSKLVPSRLGEWTNDVTAYGNFYGEIHASFLNDKINLDFGRMTREWAAMDKGSSLVLNRTAVPFYGIDFNVNVNSWLSYSFLNGNLENPNRADLLTSDWQPDRDCSDSYYFQNSFSLQMVEMNFKNLHIDFGSSVVYPKRFEFGYFFPLTVLVEYQNHVGDYDNVAMFGDIRYTWPGVAQIWGSLYTDEINDFKTNPLSGTREMFAIQGGVKVVVPQASFGTVTMRYTKVEPYCYTHHSINYVPYYDHYICENYTNNGLCIGSYLPPNADEILFRFDQKPTENISLSFAYQLVRHGADYGSQQVPGSSLYSELDNTNRDEFHKYFLHDGAYNWIHAISANGSFEQKNCKYPFKIDLTVGLVFNYFTGINQTDYNSKDQFGNSDSINFNTPYSIIDTDEYPFKIGPVISLGFTVGRF